MTQSVTHPDPRLTESGTPGGTKTSTTYQVQPGDTLFRIAQKHGLTVAALQAANPNVIPSRMSIGQEIKIPAR